MRLEQGTGLRNQGADHLPNHEDPLAGKTVVITGTSRGIGARDAVGFARVGANVVGSYATRTENRAKMQDEVLAECKAVNPNGDYTAVIVDITIPADRLFLLESAVGRLPDTSRQVDVLVLNAAGGLERDKDENYAERINFEANMALVDLFIQYMSKGSLIIFTQSMWGHLYGEIDQEPEYEPVARSKHMAEEELRRRIPELEEKGIKIGILVGDVIKNTTMFKIINRRDKKRVAEEELLVPGGIYPDPDDMARRLVDMVIHPRESGFTEYVGRTREQYLTQFSNGEITRSTD